MPVVLVLSTKMRSRRHVLHHAKGAVKFVKSPAPQGLVLGAGKARIAVEAVRGLRGRVINRSVEGSRSQKGELPYVKIGSRVGAHNDMYEGYR